MQNNFEIPPCSTKIWTGHKQDFIEAYIYTKFNWIDTLTFELVTLFLSGYDNYLRYVILISHQAGQKMGHTQTCFTKPMHKVGVMQNELEL